MPAPLLPISPEPAEYLFTPDVKNLSSEAVSGKQYSRRIGGHKWLLSLPYEPMSVADAGPMIAFLEDQWGVDGIFYVKIPLLTDVAGLNIGNMMNFDNDTKLFRITGTGPLVTQPIERIGGGLPVTSAVYLRCSLARDALETVYRKDDRVGFDVDLKERI